MLALIAAGRPWLVELVARPAPLTDERIARSGGDLMPWLPALGWVGLAGAGALLATRGRVRRMVGGVLLLAGSGLLVATARAAVAAMAPAGGVSATAHPGAGAGWALLCALGGAAVAAAGGLAAARGHRWPAMGARYERSAGRSTAARPEQIRPERRPPGARPEEMWQALDRGEDPTD